MTIIHASKITFNEKSFTKSLNDDSFWNKLNFARLKTNLKCTLSLSSSLLLLLDY